jgi:SAM-dependent methyltransferase
VTFARTDSHEARHLAESFGADAARYDRARPSYPDALVRRIVAASPGLDVLDVGIGTGIAARQFQAAGCRIVGVEVDARMADLARRGGFEVGVAPFEEWDPAGRSFDAVVAGQAWHWIDPAKGAAQAAAVLRPGGLLALFWNVFEPPADLAHSFSEVYRRTLPDSPFSGGTSRGAEAYSPILTKAVDGIGTARDFAEPEQWRFEWEWLYNRDEWLDFVPTSGGHSQLAPGKLDELLAGIGAAIDAVGGSFTMHYTTVAVVSGHAGQG